MNKYASKSAYCKNGVESIVQTLDNVPAQPRNPIVFTGSATNVTLSLTEEESVQLLSAVLAGADAIYPEKSHEVVMLLLRGYEYA